MHRPAFICTVPLPAGEKCGFEILGRGCVILRVCYTVLYMRYIHNTRCTWYMQRTSFGPVNPYYYRVHNIYLVPGIWSWHIYTIYIIYTRHDHGTWFDMKWYEVMSMMNIRYTWRQQQQSHVGRETTVLLFVLFGENTAVMVGTVFLVASARVRSKKCQHYLFYKIDEVIHFYCTRPIPIYRKRSWMNSVVSLASVSLDCCIWSIWGCPVRCVCVFLSFTLRWRTDLVECIEQLSRTWYFRF